MFAVKDSLIVDFERHEPGVTPTGEPIDVPFYTCDYDFHLAPAPAAMPIRVIRARLAPAGSPASAPTLGPVKGRTGRELT